MMGKAPVVDFLLKNSGDVEKMMGITDGRKYTGFMKACRWGRRDVAKFMLEYKACLGNKDMYDGFKLACTHKRTGVIRLIMEIDKFRSHILEEEQANVTRSPCGKVVIQQKSESKQGCVY